MHSSFVSASICYCIFLILTICIPPRCNSLGYFASLKDKHHQLNSLTSPKMIFVGGSNLAFGLDSSLLEKRFHVPVMNMGLAFPLGLRYMLEEVKDDIHAGDIVVLIPEYGLLQNKYTNGTCDLIHAMEVYPPSFFYIWHAYTGSAKSFLCLLDLIRCLPAAKWNACYSILDVMWKMGHYEPSLIDNWEVRNQIGTNIRFYFNKNGDYFGHFGRPSCRFVPDLNLITRIDGQAATLINEFNAFAKQRKAQVVLIPPPVPKEDILPSRCSPAAIATWPGQTITVPILAKPERYAFPLYLFYQPTYHLNAAGRELRTKLVSEDLVRFFNKN